MATSVPGPTPGRVAAYTTLADFLDDADRFVSARRRVAWGSSLKKRQKQRNIELDQVWTSHVHACAEQSTLELVREVRAARLTQVQREIVYALVVDTLGVRKVDGSARGLVGLLGRSRNERDAVLRAFSPSSRVQRGGVAVVVDPSEPLADQTLALDPFILQPHIRSPRAPEAVRDVASLQRYLHEAARALEERGDQVRYLELGMGSALAARRALLEAHEALACLRNSVTDSQVSLARIFDDYDDQHPHQRVVLLLAAHALGRGLAPTCGRDLLMAANVERPYRACDLRVLDTLVSRGTIEHRPGDRCNRWYADYRLTTTARERYGVPTRRSSRIEHVGGGLDTLALTPAVRRALGPVLDSGRAMTATLSAWGLDDTIPYGSGLTVLLSGPAGVGKTACARAVAGELGRGLLTARYDELLSRWVGQTERNVAKLFALASDHDAVLLLDEADTLLYDRARATRSWEVSAVNVLLTELERFEGVCFLTTNRKLAMDPALSRRIAIKIHIERPDHAQRRQIWRVLIPAQMPLSPDVDIERLSTVDLSGGEIKNVVLQAARLAAVRAGSAEASDDAQAQVTQADFEAALVQELEGRWQRDGSRPAGFALSVRS